MRDADDIAAYQAHVNELIARMTDGDEFAMKSLACMAWLVERLGRGTPPPDGGIDITTFEGDVIDIAEWMKRRAA